jgi:polar amino acid transport system permease protein
LIKKKIRFTPLDFVILLLLAALSGYIVYRAKAQLNYRWEWSVIPQYLFRYDEEAGSWVTNLLTQGLFTTIRLSFWATLLATVLGSVMGFFRVSQSLFKRMVGRTYVETVRNLPPLVLVFLFFYFFSDQILPVLQLDDFVRNSSDATRSVITFLFSPPDRLAGFLAAVSTLALYEGAYITEIVRAGIESVEKGQWEASYALGLSWWQQMRFIVLPQALQRTIPPLAGQFISTIKDSAIVSVISIQELTFQGLQLMAATYMTFEVWITIMLLYLVLTLTCSLGARRLETYMNRGQG